MTFLMWETPCPGITKIGDPCSVVRIEKMTIEDVVCFERACLIQGGMGEEEVRKLSDEELVYEFKVVHWAWEVEE